MTKEQLNKLAREAVAIITLIALLMLLAAVAENALPQHP